MDNGQDLNNAAKWSCSHEETASCDGELVPIPGISLCHNCFCMTKTLMDADGKRFCGKCKAYKTTIRANRDVEGKEKKKD